ncbi:NACHT domain-containing protein [Kitasatospora sp. NPDC056184]|uniref:NACHT domain-containing protein n=1 Tax=Kitasatospora sp. NPDC056184 TaxID=3345738 RepID=UPI0035E2F6AD
MKPGPWERGSRRRWLRLAWGGAAVLTATLMYVVLRPVWSRTPSLADRIAFLSLVVALVSLVVGLRGLRRPVERDTANQSRGWAAELANQVKQAESRQRRQLLGGDTHRINLTFTLRAAPARAANAPGEGRLFDGTPTVPDIAAYWRATRPRRLVVTGAAGSGKTVLALELILALIKDRDADDPVPVRLSLASWDTRVPLSDLLVRRLVEAYGWPVHMATELVRHHRVLPVLDGLDEMDPTLPDGTPAPDAHRALEALRALNAYQDGREAGPLVLTCRTAHYDALDARARLIDAVPPADAHTYLSQRTVDRDRWQPVLDALRDDPTGPLATTLSTPWRLCLAATVYARDHDPADLLAHTTPADLDAHLLDRFILATTTLHPGPYSAADTHRWLARLAHHLATHPVADAPAGPGTDLALHQLWPMAGATRVKLIDAALTALVMLSPIMLMLEPSGISEGPVARIVTVCVYAAVAALTVFLTARSRTDRPAGTDLAALRTSAGRRHVRRALLTGLLVGAACAAVIWAGIWVAIWATTEFADREILDYSPMPGVTSSLAFVGAAVGLTRGIAVVLRVRPAAAVVPRRVIRGELVLGAALALVAALTVMIGFFLTVTVHNYLVYPPSEGYENDIAGTAVAAFCLGLFAGLGAWLSRSGARRYLVFLLCSRGRLPRRLGVFLDHCCDAGLMRISGSSYQFRHRELQHWLAAHPNPPTASTDPIATPAHHA